MCTWLLKLKTSYATASRLSEYFQCFEFPLLLFHSFFIFSSFWCNGIQLESGMYLSL